MMLILGGFFNTISTNKSKLIICSVNSYSIKNRFLYFGWFELNEW
jgi:hypothetical protein